MPLITYNEWKNTCKMTFDISDKSWDKYLQTYPFSIISDYDKAFISSKFFFNKYILNNYLFMIPKMLSIPFNYLQKSNGLLRITNLVNPLIYLYVNAIGLHIYDVIGEKANSSYYAGNYINNELGYKKSYEKYITESNIAASEYDMYFKTDLSSFFDSIDVNLLFDLIEEESKDKIDAKTLYIYKILLKYIGKGRYPTINGNTGLSYIASEILLGYLDELINNELTNNHYINNNFKIVRYVDDYYIFFNTFASFKGNEYLNLVKTSIETIFFNVCSKLRLNVNISKTKCDFCNQISHDLIKQSYDMYINDNDINYNELFGKNDLIVFLQKLLKNNNNYINHSTIQQIANKTFVESDVTSREIGLEVINWYIYENSVLFKDENVINLLRELVKDHFGVFQQMPRVFVQMLVKTRDEEAIKNFLDKIFQKSRKEELTKYDILMALEYLKQTHFKHNDLLEVIKLNQKNIYEFIYYYCESNFISYIENENNKIIDTNPNFKDDSTLNFMFLMYKYYDRNSSILPKYAYYKNYFDRYLSYLLSELNIIEKKKHNKINFKRTYDKNIIKDMKDIISKTQQKQLKKAFKHRNENIISHASAESFNDSNLKSKEYKNDINNLEGIIKCLNKLLKP